MTRIVAGRYGGRRLVTPAGRDTRPTADRVREALFSTLESLVDLTGTRFADLYAGSGAVGLEAASRGAAAVLLVESDRQAAKAARANVAALDLGSLVQIVTAPVRNALAIPPDQRYDVVFADPPYAVPDSELAAVQAALVEHGWLAPDAIVVLERASRDPEPTWATGITGDRSRRYGETTLWYGRLS